MLAQNLMTPAKLGIDDAEFGALVTVLGMLERNELKHARPSEPTYHEGREIGLFNMAWWNTNSECGTVCCIGGTAELLLGREFGETPDALDRLFFPGEDYVLAKYEEITPAHAAIALRNYLTTGEPNWAEALA